MPGEQTMTMHKFPIPEVGPSLRDGGGGGGVGERKTLPNFNDNTTTNAYESLRARGVVAAAQVAKTAAPDLIAAWCEHADRNASMTAGSLVAAIRSGTPPPEPRRTMIDEQREYAVRLATWLEANMPDVCRPARGPHPAAVAELIRLHYRHGKHAVTVAEHGARIRRAVSDFERELSG